jgi:hypothetical protein
MTTFLTPKFIRETMQLAMQERGLDYQTLAQKLTIAGLSYSSRDLALDIETGQFKASTFVQILCIMGVKEISLPRPENQPQYFVKD